MPRRHALRSVRRRASVRAPHAEHRDDVAAADVDEVLAQQVAGEVVLDAAGALVAAEQRHVARIAVGREAAIEAHHVVVRVAGGGGHEAHPRSRRTRERQDVVVEQRAVSLHRETSASERNDLWRSAWHDASSTGSTLKGRSTASTDGAASSVPLWTRVQGLPARSTADRPRRCLQRLAIWTGVGRTSPGSGRCGDRHARRHRSRSPPLSRANSEIGHTLLLHAAAKLPA